MIDWISQTFDAVQLILYENVVQPVVFGLGFGNLLEDAFNATGWLMLGLVQIAVMVAGIRLLERRWPVEPVTDHAAVRVDVFYTLIHRLGLVRLAMFFSVTVSLTLQVVVLMTAHCSMWRNGLGLPLSTSQKP